MTQKKALWTCPDCGRQFASRNTWHSCGSYDLEGHFAEAGPKVRQAFDRLVEAVEAFGPVTIHALKTRIVFQARTQFAAVVPRRRWLNGQLWLKRRVEGPPIRRIEMGVYRDYGHLFRVSEPGEIDQDLVDLLHEAYVVASE